MNELKIAIVTLYNPFEKIRGGIESVVYNLSMSLAKTNIETWILTMGDVEKETIERHNGINLWIIPDKGHKGLFIRSLIFIKDGRKVIQKMHKRYNIDIFNGQAGHSAPLAFANIKHGKIILTVHTIDRENFADMKDYWRMKKYKQLSIEIFKYPILKIWRLFYFLNSDDIIFVSNSVFTEFKRFYPFMKNKKCNIIENGSPKIDSVSHTVKKEHDFIYVGRIDVRKGVDLIIKAGFLLKKDGFRFDIVIIGDGLLRKDFEELTTKLNMDDIITFTGYLKNYNDLLKNISKSKFLIFPSSYESDPLVIKESLQTGIPVIASNIPSLIGKVTDGENGYLFKNGSYIDLYKTMVKVLSINEYIYRQLSERAKKQVEKNTWEDVAKIYAKSFELM